MAYRCMMCGYGSVTVPMVNSILSSLSEELLEVGRSGRWSFSYTPVSVYRPMRRMMACQAFDQALRLSTGGDEGEKHMRQ
jgi:hypothetical protein